MQQEVTIYDIAKMANVSPSTVSRVVNNRPNVKKATRTRILKLLSDHGYAPNETARSLVMQTSRMIGILISDIRTTHHTDGIFYLQRELAKQDYSCLIYNTGTELTDQIRYIQAISQRKVDAAVLMGSIYQTAGMQEAIQKYLSTIPVFICNGYLDLPNVYGIIADEKNGVSDCVHMLAEAGRENLAFVVNQSTPSSILKKEGFEYGVSKFCNGSAPLFFETGSDIESVYRSTQALLKSHPEISGIIFSEDMLAVIGVRAMTEMGLRVPSDIAVVGINNSHYAELCTPTLTSLDNMLYDLSLTAAKEIIDVLRGEHVNKKMMICSHIVRRQST